VYHHSTIANIFLLVYAPDKENFVDNVALIVTPATLASYAKYGMTVLLLKIPKALNQIVKIFLPGIASSTKLAPPFLHCKQTPPVYFKTSAQFLRVAPSPTAMKGKDEGDVQKKVQ
jgi:hypothetical protein